MLPVPESTRPGVVQQFVTDVRDQDVSLRLVREADAAFIVELRTSPDASQFLSASTQDVAAQQEWIQAYRTREDAGQEFYFIVTYHNEPVGCVRMYDFRDESFCWGSWILKPGQPGSVALQVVAAIYDLGFRCLQFPGAHFSVVRENKSVHRFHRRMGAESVGEDDEQFHFEITRQAVTEFLTRRGLWPEDDNNQNDGRQVA